MDKLREEFEAAYRKAAERGKFTPDFRVLKNGDYMQPALYWAYWAWVESRAAIKVELPHCNNESHDEYRSCVEIELDKEGVGYE